MTNKPDYYKILQVDPEAEPEVVTAAYRRLAAKYHPDVNRASDAEDRMRDLNQAYAVISDPAKRSDYDRQRAARTARATTTGSATRPSYYADHARQRRSSPFAVAALLRLGAKGTTKSLTLEISVTEGRTLIGDLRVSHPWIHLSTTRLFSATTIVNVEVDTTGLRDGSIHNGRVTIDSIAYGTRSVPVSLQVETPAAAHPGGHAQHSRFRPGCRPGARPRC